MNQDHLLTPVTEPETRTNDRGNTVKSWGYETRALSEDRYYWDCGPCSGWTQYDTDQDASYFGVWVDVEGRRILTYAEGDLSLVECPTEGKFGAELLSMAECYGPPSRAFRAIDKDGKVTDYYAERLS